MSFNILNCTAKNNFDKMCVENESLNSFTVKNVLKVTKKWFYSSRAWTVKTETKKMYVFPIVMKLRIQGYTAIARIPFSLQKKFSYHFLGIIFCTISVINKSVQILFLNIDRNWQSRVYKSLEGNLIVETRSGR